MNIKLVGTLIGISLIVCSLLYIHHNIAPPKMNGRTILTMFPSMVFCSIGAKVIVSLNFEL